MEQEDKYVTDFKDRRQRDRRRGSVMGTMMGAVRQASRSLSRSSFDKQPSTEASEGAKNDASVIALRNRMRTNAVFYRQKLADVDKMIKTVCVCP